MSEDITANEVAGAPEESGTELGPNPFEAAYHATRGSSVEEGSAVPATGTGTGMDQGTASAASLPGYVSNSGSDSFLTSEEKASFDTNSPEYKAMQASFTRKMQALAEQERALNTQSADVQQRLSGIEQHLNAAPEEGNGETTQLSGIQWNEAAFTPLAVPEELEEYQDLFENSLTTRMQEVAEFVLQQAEQRAQQALLSEQYANMQRTLQEQATEFQSNPDYADYAEYYAQMKEIAEAKPDLLSQPDGLKRVYRLAKTLAGETVSQAAPQQGDQYARGVKAGLGQVQARRASAVPQSPQVNVSTSPAKESYKSLDEAITAEFARAVQGARS